MKNFAVLVLSFIFFMGGFIGLRFGSALFQEGNPAPILLSVAKLELSGGGYELFSESSGEKRYISEDTGQSRNDVVKEYMEGLGWEFQEQMGAGLFFHKGGQTVVVETRQYSRHYFLWDVPVEVLQPSNPNCGKMKCNSESGI